MSFSVRHEGSPKSVSDLSFADVTAGLRDGRWEPTDEVWDDDQGRWLPLEDHPRFAEAAADVAIAPRKIHEDETRLDMNPLIDVALVLLIFFILTTTYETIRKVLDLPGASSQTASRPIPVLKPDDAKKLTIMVTARQKDGQPVIRVEDKAIGLDELDATLQRAVVDTKKTTLLLDASPDVEYGVVMAIMDAARGAGISKTLMVKSKN